MERQEQSVEVTAARAQGEVVDLAIHCTRCGGALEVQFANWQANGPLEAHHFPCPYCSRQNNLSVPARLVWASERSTRTRH